MPASLSRLLALPVLEAHPMLESDSGLLSSSQSKFAHKHREGAYFASANGPHWFVSYHYIVKVTDLVSNCGQLCVQDVIHLHNTQ